MELAIKILLSYLIGSINFAYWLGKVKGIDISKWSDGNLGVFSLYHTSRNKILAGLALVLDILKAYIPTFLWGPFIGAFAVLGHCFSIISSFIIKRPDTGAGIASVIGFLLASDIRLLLFGTLLYLIGFLYFGKKLWFMDRGIISYACNFYIFPLTLSFAIYINSPAKLGFLIVTLTILIVSFIRVKRNLEFWLFKAKTK